MAKNNRLILSLALVGLILLALSFYISTQTEHRKSNDNRLARLDLNLGKAFVLRKNLTKKEVLSSRAHLFQFDSVETGADGDATLEFESAYRIRVQENSLITIDKEVDQVLLIIKRGDVIVENFGREGSVFISREGMRWNATEYETVYKKQAPGGSLPEGVPNESPITTSATAMEEGPNSDYIQDILKTHRNSFFKCYTQLLQKVPGVAGHATLSFTIEPTGKVFQAQISTSNISDDAFKKCLIEAVRRVEFKSFKGVAVSTSFPLRFE